MQTKFSPPCLAFVTSLMSGAVATAGYRYIGLMEEDRLLYPELNNVVRLTQSPGGEIVGRNGKEWTDFVIEVRNASNAHAKDSERLRLLLNHPCKFSANSSEAVYLRVIYFGRVINTSGRDKVECLDNALAALKAPKEKNDDNL